MEQPQDILAELDKPMALHCRAEASSLDDLRVNWYKDGRLVTMDPNARIITEFMALHIINTMPQDAGTYYCVAENSFGRSQSRTAQVQFLSTGYFLYSFRLHDLRTLFVEFDKDFPVSPTSTTASIGERVRLRCEPPHGAPKPTVYWTKDGKNLSIPLDHHDLILSAVQQSDFGTYRCIGFNGRLIRQSAPAYLTEFHRPKISIRPTVSRLDVLRGKSIDLQCHVESVNDDDQYEIEWHYGHRNGPVLGRSNRLDIASVQFNHSGLYVCLVIYNSGRKRHLFSEEISLAVHERSGEKVFSQTNLKVYAGRSAILECQLPLNSNEKITWTIVNRSDLSLDNQHRFEYLDENQYRLRIIRVEEFDNDLSLECSYQRQKSRSQGLIKLQLERIEPPPILIYVPNNQTVPIGVEVLFSCQTKEKTKVQWWFIGNSRSHKSIPIETNQKYRIETNHDLIIRHVNK